MVSSPRLTATRLTTLLAAYDRRPGPAYVALTEAIRLLVTDGRVVVGTRLPSERALATSLGVSRTTVASAYAALRDRGFAQARHGSGTTVTLPRGGGSVVAPAADLPSSSRLGMPGPAQGDVIDLGCAAISPAVPAVAEAFTAAGQALPRHLDGHGYTATGLTELREAIAERYEQRGLPTSPDQVLVTNGALAALRLALVALTGPGDRLLLEAPSYPNAIDTVRRCSLRPSLLPLDHDGWDVDTVSAVVRQSAPHAAYLMPDFHNPTGLLMNDERREQVAGVLRAGRVATIVDETTVELAYDVESMPLPYAAHDPQAVCLGSTSKAHWGGLRTGWLRAPLDLVGALVQARATLDLGTALFEQLVAARLVADADALDAQRTVLRSRRDRLVRALREQLPELDVPRPAGGMALWTHLPDRFSGHLVSVAARHGLLLAAGPRFTAGVGLDDRLRLPFTADETTLDEAVRRLAEAYDEARATSPDSGTAPARTLIA